MNRHFQQIFKVVKVITGVPQPVYELSDLQDRSIEGQFYSFELGKVIVSPETAFQIDKIVRTRNKTVLNISSSGKVTITLLIVG